MPWARPLTRPRWAAAKSSGVMSADEQPVPLKLVCLDHVMLDDDLSSSAVLVAHTLVRHMNSDGSEAFPAVSTIVRLTHLGEETVRRTLDELRSRGWIRTTRRFRNGLENSSRHDALPSWIVNDGTSPLHEADQWEAHRALQREKNRKKKARQRQKKRDVYPCHVGGCRQKGCLIIAPM